jgi:hypothetical protein
LAPPPDPPRFVKDEPALTDVLLRIKLIACPHCQRTGALIGHGFLRGYAEKGSESAVHGRRFFCSDRGRRSGCGRTFSVQLESVLSGFVVGTFTLWCFVRAVLSGLTRRAAWLRAARGTLSLSSAYRLWRRLGNAQSALRSRLSSEAPAPGCASRESLAQLVAHLGAVLGDTPIDLLAAYQHRVQRGVFDR